MNFEQQYKKLLRLLSVFDAKGQKNESYSAIDKRTRLILTRQEALRLVLFTCSTVKGKYLFSETPWKYVGISPDGNNLEVDLSRLSKIEKAITRIYPKVKVTALIGNTDPYYIYLRQLKRFSIEDRREILDKFSRRWKKYRVNLERWIRSKYNFKDLEIINWYDFETKIKRLSGNSFEKEYEFAYKNAKKLYKLKALNWEYQKMKTRFEAGSYFSGVNRPSSLVLKDWVKRKFAEYAVQGKWIYEQFPNAILIQNEKPSDLRSQMYQPLIQKNYDDVLPIVYFFGVDNRGYR